MSKLLQQGIDLWTSGGWAMIPMAVNALILYAKAAEVRIVMAGKNGARRRMARRARAIRVGDEGHAAEERETAVAMAFLRQRDIALPERPTLKEMQAAFDELRAEELPPVDRDLKLIKVAMSAAPLWGLLGTVTGMLTTFAGLAGGGGADDTMDTVAGGISEALITTQTGLTIAIPGYFLHYYLKRLRDQYETYITHIETSATRHFLKLGPSHAEREEEGGNNPEGLPQTP